MTAVFTPSFLHPDLDRRPDLRFLPPRIGAGGLSVQQDFALIHRIGMVQSPLWLQMQP